MSARLNELKKRLRPGQVYRRSELMQWTNAVDRHLKALQAEGALTKLSGGLYYCPKKTVFGNVPADEKKLVETFLKDSRFLLSSSNAYNALGVGTTQLYNDTVVYNHKRHGRFKLGGRFFDFRMKPYFPKTLSKEFLLVDLVNNLEQLAEDTDSVLERVQEKAVAMDTSLLSRLARDYGNVSTKRFFEKTLSETQMSHAA